MIAVDFGTGAALAIYGDEGREEVPRLPRVAGGAATSDKFSRILPILLGRDDVVVESPTVGSSGVEPDEVARIVASAPHTLYVISARATKNYKKDHDITWDKGARYAKGTDAQGITIQVQPSVHESDAQIIHIIATEHPERLKVWHPPTLPKLQRQHTSVRPHDKRNYRGEEPDSYMSRWPEFHSLPPHLQQLFGNNYGTPKAEYSRRLALPFAMAMDEPGADTRPGFERIIGLYDHGFPSFYRRVTIDLIQKLAKYRFGVNRFEEVSRAQRKEAWRETRLCIRQAYHLLSQSSPRAAGVTQK